MNPEDDPRYLPPPIEFVPDSVSAAEIEEDLRYHEEVTAMFNTKGWKHLEIILSDVRENHVNRLTKFSGADSMDVIYGLRSGLSLIDEILGVKDSSAAAIIRNRELLSKLRERTPEA